MKRITLHDKTFRLSIPNDSILAAIEAVAMQINSDYADRKPPIFMGVLNGAFLFMGELMQRITLPCEVTFVKIASYQGTESTGSITQLIGANEQITGRDVIVVEDIVETGNSITFLVEELARFQPRSIAFATLLYKPDAYNKAIEVDYCAISIPDRFVVGFGLDYDGLGRNYKDIYELDE